MKLLAGLICATAILGAVNMAQAQNTNTNMSGGSSSMTADCTDAGMSSANSAMMKMSDKSKQDMAMKEMGMAKDAMAKKDMAGCKTHMDKAMGMMK